jgi:AcrR family transcriptional regulator
MAENARMGRHRIVSDEEILRAAFLAYAHDGYEAMSVRRLNSDLGLSHETVRQRFGSKLELFFAALEYGIKDFFELLLVERSKLPDSCSDIDELRALVASFMWTAYQRPDLGRLVNQEGAIEGVRVEHIFATGFEPLGAMVTDLLHRLVEEGVIYPTTVRDLFFTLQAGLSPFLLGAMSRAFDPSSGPLDPDEHIKGYIDFVTRGLMRSTTA